MLVSELAELKLENVLPVPASKLPVNTCIMPWAHSCGNNTFCAAFMAVRVCTDVLPENCDQTLKWQQSSGKCKAYIVEMTGLQAKILLNLMHDGCALQEKGERAYLSQSTCRVQRAGKDFALHSCDIPSQ